MVEAFLAVRSADLSGVAPNNLLRLIEDLNTALALQRQSNSTGSIADATTSITLLTQVSSRAHTLEGEMMAQSLRIGILTYSLAFWAAAGSSFLVVESHRIVNFVRRLRARKLLVSSRT